MIYLLHTYLLKKICKPKITSWQHRILLIQWLSLLTMVSPLQFESLRGFDTAVWCLDSVLFGQELFLFCSTHSDVHTNSNDRSICAAHYLLLIILDYFFVYFIITLVPNSIILNITIGTIALQRSKGKLTLLHRQHLHPFLIHGHSMPKQLFTAPQYNHTIEELIHTHWWFVQYLNGSVGNFFMKILFVDS